ncbi:hypothetical protein [Streptomyces sp. NBC_00847]|uniref:hypothetical protein n=1 Tax=Streptomyces sp. NBC_00847 TaxID=2975850 RepID=UPI00225E649A|nr:hypothetical protein [Streptomyces sp. NBC_00847]MCX4885895.1 hypothetical protein [Streptomyces sp. NBC_00847]
MATRWARLEDIAIDKDEGGTDLVTFREAAKRVVEEGISPSMSHQRISKLYLTDDNFPPVQVIGRAKVVDWVKARPYFVAHAQKAAKRDIRRRIEREGGSE